MSDYETEVLALSPAGYWRLGEDTGTDAADLGSGANNGTYNNTPVLGAAGLLTDDLDTAVTFARTSSEDVTMGNVLDFAYNEPFTLCAWINSSDTTNAQGIIGKQAIPAKGYSMYLSGGNLVGTVLAAYTTNGIRKITTATIADGVDHFVVMTYDGSTNASGLKLYVDNVLQATTTTFDNLTSSIAHTEPFAVGSLESTDNYMEGEIDEPAIFGAELTALDVARLYYTGLGHLDRYEQDVLGLNPVGYWRLGEAAGTNAVDETLSGNDGTYANTPTLDVEGAISEDIDTAVTFASASSEHVDMGDVLDFQRTDAFSICGWFKTTTAATQDILSKQEGISDYSGYDFRVNSTGGMQVMINSAITNRIVMDTIAETFADGAWHFGVLTYDGSSAASGVTIYVDGVSEAMTTDHDTLTGSIDNTVALRVGGRSDGNLMFDGGLDEVAVYDYELSGVQQLFLYASGTYVSPPAGLDANYRNTVLALRPAGYWRLGEDTGTNAVDEMRRNDGTYTNTPTLGVVGALANDADTAVTFLAASTEYVDMGDVLAFERTDAFSMCGWFKTTSATSQCIMSKRGPTTLYRGYDLITASGYLQTSIRFGSANQISVKTTSTAFADGAWHFGVLTYDGSSAASGVTIYVDGVSEALTIEQDTLTSSILIAVPFRIGGRSDDNVMFNGTLDECAIFAHELTAKDVAAMYYMGLGKQGYEYEVLKLNPAGYWRLGEDTGTNAVDETVNGNDGTYNNTPVLGTAGLLTNDIDTAVTFDRDNSEDVTMGNVLPFERTAPFSVCCWVNCSEAVASVGLVGKTSSAGKGYSIYLSSGNLTGLIANTFTTNGIRVRAEAALTADGTDHFLVMTYDGSSNASGMNLYVDGVLQTDIDITQDNLSSSILSTAQVTVGSFGNGGTYADGVIDEPAIFGTELTAQEVHDLYTYGKEYRTALSSFTSAMWQARPVGWWKLGEDTGTNAADVLGLNDGTYVNTPTLGVAGAISTDDDTAVSFAQASSEYVDMGNVFAFEYNDPFSLSCWFKTSYSTACVLMGKQGSTGNSRGYALIMVADGGFQFQLASVVTTTDFALTTPSDSYNDDNWHHVVVTYDGSTDAAGVTLYLDGVSIGLTIARNNLGSNTTVDTTSFNLASRNDGALQDFDGELDEAAVFDHELTGTEVRRIFWEAAGYSRYALAQLSNGELLSYWRLGELEGTNAADVIGSNAGTYVGTPTLATESLVPNDTDKAVYFDSATPEYVTMGDVLDFTHVAPFSVGCWVTTASANASFVTKYGTVGFILYIAGGVLTVILSAGSGDEIRVTFGTGYDDGLPHCYTVTYDGSTNASGMTMYVDGVEAVRSITNDTLSSSPTNAASLNIASRNDGTSVNMTGTADEVWKASIELTANQVADMYIAGLLSYTESGDGQQYIEAVTDSPTMAGLIGATANHSVVDATNIVEVLATHWGRTVSESFNWEVGIGIITTLTESFNAGTSIDTLRNQIGAVVESVQFALTENIEHAKGILEGLAMNEAWAARAILQGNLSETLTYADVIQLTWDQLQTETVNVTDTSAPYAQKAAALAELFVAAGIVDTLYKAAGIIAEAIILQDLVERYFELSAVDSVTMTDVEANLYRAVAANIESAAMADSLSGTRRLSLLVSDDLTSGDVDVATAICNVLATDSAIFGGAITLPDGVFSAIVLNTESLGISEYTNYPFNSFGKLDNDYLGASDTDIFQLTGDDDAGTDIDAVIRTGMTNFGTNVFKRVPRAYLGYTSDGGLIMKTISTSGGTKTERWYELSPRTGDHASDAHAAARIKLGRGIKATYWQFELINKLGSDFDIDMLQLYPMILSRRV